MIELEKVSFRYEKHAALKNVNLKIEAGEKVALLGSNGSGKSTLLRILAALYFPTEGTYLFQGIKVDKQSAKQLRPDLGIVFQNPDAMIFNPTVYDEIAFSLREFRFEDIEGRIRKIAASFGLDDFLEKSPLKLSGGEKQKVILASILAYDPKLLLLDEPTTAMDPKTTGWLIDLLWELKTTIVLATHDLSVAYETCPRAVVLDESHRIIYDGEMEPLMENIDLLVQANLIHKHKHRHKKFVHSHYHLHF